MIGNGGNINERAGDTYAASSVGGSIFVTGGSGLSTSSQNGGSIALTGGLAKGGNTLIDVGGFINLLGGTSASSRGGSLILGSGVGRKTSSGDVTLYTADSGVAGASGSIDFFTGIATRGNSGYVAINTGSSKSGRGGAIDVLVGSGSSGNGGSVFVSAGDSSMQARSEGTVQISGGNGM